MRDYCCGTSGTVYCVLAYDDRLLFGGPYIHGFYLSAHASASPDLLRDAHSMVWTHYMTFLHPRHCDLACSECVLQAAHTPLKDWLKTTPSCHRCHDIFPDPWGENRWPDNAPGLITLKVSIWQRSAWNLWSVLCRYIPFYIYLSACSWSPLDASSSQQKNMRLKKHK